MLLSYPQWLCARFLCLCCVSFLLQGVTGRCSCSRCFLLSAITRSRSRNLEGGVSLLSLPACPSAVRSPRGNTKPLLTCPLSNTACSAEGLPLKDHKQRTSAL
ncbi:hypothetical protein ATANTOWER_011347 [Ataeniobius toweri]|uniref:Secreted protein n=1 Tax=Ataeniobius toweri TaxID=208326 RepID=A0ABU7C6Z0_9TELE|nr:hypothetical protein [Ataeniobius toweri]